MNQVVTIEKDGTISGLQRKRGQGIDLRQFGHAQIERASEIKWDERQQKWTVCVLRLRDMFVGKRLNASVWRQATRSNDLPEHSITDDSGVLLFQDYDDAVKAEITFLDALRCKGIF